MEINTSPTTYPRPQIPAVYLTHRKLHVVVGGFIVNVYREVAFAMFGISLPPYDLLNRCAYRTPFYKRYGIRWVR